jgi:hypothetical protein
MKKTCFFLKNLISTFLFFQKKMKTIHDSPTIHSFVKTTIEKGIVKRTVFWKDTMGNNYDKINGVFVPKNPPPPKYVVYQSSPSSQNSENNTNVSQQTVENTELFIFCCLVSIVVLSFLGGFFLGILRTRRQQDETNIKNQLRPSECSAGV